MGRKELHIISTGTQSLRHFAEIAGAIEEYVDYVHIREKSRSAKELYEAVEQLAMQKVPLEKIIINDRIDVAIVTSVAGVQLGYQSLDIEKVREKYCSLKIGASIHSTSEGIVAERKGASFCIYGHLFQTKSKEGLLPRGVEELKEITEKLSIPVIGIGGIKPSNTREVIGAGAKGIAVMSGILEAKDPIQRVKEYVRELSKGEGTR
ncbi:thiazole tautomerase TenI [Bacillus timonensis]|nr:thiazole tautomerase TenI [Bacillus timonensis]